jgi:hypothetical protein
VQDVAARSCLVDEMLQFGVADGDVAVLGLCCVVFVSGWGGGG